MSEKLGLYRCLICGNIVEVVIDGIGALVCCGQEMDILKANTQDAATEKHVPFIVESGDEMIIRIGETEHPMEEKHYIQFIELISKDKRYIKRKYLYPSEKPELRLKCKYDQGFDALEYCNIHGLWAKEG